MQYTIEEIHHKIYDKVNTVYSIFQNFFGEEFVDLQGVFRYGEIKTLLKAYGYDAKSEDSGKEYYEIQDEYLNNLSAHIIDPIILVWWPEVTVTNEHNRSIKIQDLYAKIPISSTGKIPYEKHGFSLNRATYPLNQFLSNYMHSHVSHIPTSDFAEFQDPCLGRGPIIQTILTLKDQFDEASWLLFCQELSMYVTVESLRGVPYKRLEDVGVAQPSSAFGGYEFDDTSSWALPEDANTKELFRGFMLYYMQHGHLSFSYNGKEFIPGIPYYNYIIDISNTFIEYFNTLKCPKTVLTELFTNNVLTTVIVKENSFWTFRNSRNPDAQGYNGRFVCTFKGRVVSVSIIDTGQQAQTSTLLCQQVAMHILSRILKVINFRFKNERSRRNEGSTPSSTYQKVYYL